MKKLICRFHFTLWLEYPSSEFIWYFSCRKHQKPHYPTEYKMPWQLTIRDTARHKIIFEKNRSLYLALTYDNWLPLKPLHCVRILLQVCLQKNK